MNVTTQPESFRVVVENEDTSKLYLNVSKKNIVEMFATEDRATIFESPICARDRIAEYMSRAADKNLKIYVEVETYESDREWHWIPLNVSTSVNTLITI